jgi:hypothetical protein
LTFDRGIISSQAKQSVRSEILQISVSRVGSNRLIVQTHGVLESARMESIDRGARRGNRLTGGRRLLSISNYSETKAVDRGVQAICPVFEMRGFAFQGAKLERGITQGNNNENEAHKAKRGRAT